MGSLDELIEEAFLELRLFEVSAEDESFAVKNLTSELIRTKTPSDSLVILRLSERTWENLKAGDFCHWLQGLRSWLEERQSTLVILCQTESALLHHSLLSCSEYLSGMARVQYQETQASDLLYQVSFWHHPLGVCTEQSFRFTQETEGLGLVRVQALTCEDVPIDPLQQGNPHYQYLAHSEVLAGSPLPNEQWLVFDSLHDLLQQVPLLRAGMLLLSVSNSEQIEDLARQLHALKTSFGQLLKVTVRETAPCLRHRDECLLRACGVSLIAPYGLSFAQLLGLLDDGSKGRYAAHQMADFRILRQHFCPPSVQGVLSPRHFWAVLEPVYEQAEQKLNHQLVKLWPAGGLTPEQTLSQIQLRRMGDVASILGGHLYLFLFACEPHELELALGNICRLPWRGLFSELQTLDGLASLDSLAFKAATEVPEEHTVSGLLASPVQPDVTYLNPQRACLPGLSAI